MVDQFHASRSIRRKGSRVSARWTRDGGDESSVEDDHTIVEEDMHIVAETEMPHPFEAEALTITYVTPQTTTRTPTTDDMKVNPLVETYVTAPTSIEPSIHTNRRFHGGPCEYFVLTRYVDL